MRFILFVSKINLFSSIICIIFVNEKEIKDMDRLRFRSFGSGSSGNCYFLGNATTGILIDAGIGVRTVKRHLKMMGLDFSNIWGVFITHDHADHIRAAGSIGEKHHVPVYTTAEIHNGINRNYVVTQKLSSCQKFIEIDQEFTIGEFKIKAFHVSHDATDCLGYRVEYRGKVFTFATDLGVIDEQVASNLVDSDYLVLEANYDDEMLSNGPYPIHLQHRIRANTGHLCNTQTAEFLADNFSDRWKIVFLCHLSKENNSPERACATIDDRLKAKDLNLNKRLEIIPLERRNVSKLYVFD